MAEASSLPCRCTRTTMTELALQLKSDGNKLYAEKDFKGARAKYTEAIAEDGANAVLYANRAACNIGLKR